MTTFKQDQEFTNAIISTSLLDEAIDWIASNLDPEGVFSDDQLVAWALENDFVKTDE